MRAIFFSNAFWIIAVGAVWLSAVVNVLPARVADVVGCATTETGGDPRGEDHMCFQSVRKLV